MMKAALLVALVAPRVVAAECRPTVTLAGDAALVASIGTDLVGRGIAITAEAITATAITATAIPPAIPDAGACPVTQARVERTGDGLVVWISDASREVRETQTAAAVIESFVRDDVGSPLLAARPIRPNLAHTSHARADLADETPAPTPHTWPSGVHLVAGLESSVADDETHWFGLRLAACYMVGPLCPGVRLRGSAVTEEDADWDPAWRRKSSELLAAIDVPFRVGRYVLTLGVAGGIGGITTKSSVLVPNRSSGFRAEAMVALSLPISAKLALDLYATATAAQRVETEAGFVEGNMVPPEPLGFLRLGVAMRWGRR